MSAPFPRPLTPGAYLKRRRQAALLTPAEVAERFATEPRLPQLARAHLVELIEADAAPARLETIAALHSAFRFDLRVLARLSEIQLGSDLPAPRLCRVCACGDNDPCGGALGVEWCCWVDADLCSFCAPARPAAAAGFVA